MKACPFCAEDIQDAAIVCKHCGRDIPRQSRSTALSMPEIARKRNWGRWVLAGGAVWLLFVFIGVSSNRGGSSANASPENDPVKIAQLNTFVEKAKTTGVIHSLNVRAHSVQVDPALWRYFDADAKRGFTISVAAYCNINNGKDGRFVDVIDAQSGKKIASYDPFGFKVY